MSNFKEASRIGLRFETSKGALSTEQLWTLPLLHLATVVRNLKALTTKDNDDDLAFLDEKSTPVDKVVELRFTVAKEIYLAKQAENVSARDAKTKKAHNEKILGLIAEKQEGNLKNLSEEELVALLKD
tara:strand:+ start:12185 stop:12568 length:384 start_codon:yes stop_codon:yes gene_type:complete